MLVNLHIMVELIRFDMSEYVERHAVYVLLRLHRGMLDLTRGLLTEEITKKPVAILWMKLRTHRYIQSFIAGNGPRAVNG